ncbi:MAG: DUF4240 domain-containing protein [Planctomycetota bacterium]|nr:DUF4240 domain-containing protein [Planctomycetota bacterium]
MNDTKFWSLIDASRDNARKLPRRPAQDFADVQEQTLTALLKQLTPDEICDFDATFYQFHRKAYRWDLWAVAYWLHGGCSDDGFIDFRARLISLGEKVFQRALRDPDSLAEVAGEPDVPYLASEGFQYIASKIYEEMTGEEMPLALDVDGIPDEPAGDQFDFEDEELVRERFPGLLEKFPEMGD